MVGSQRCLPKEPVEVLAAADGPREDSVVTGEGGGHDVALGFATGVALTVMYHPETEAKKTPNKQTTGIKIGFPVRV